MTTKNHPLMVTEAIARREEYSREYQHLYDMVGDVDAGIAERYCETLIGFDTLFNVSNLVRFAKADTSGMTVDQLYDHLGDEGIVAVISPKTRTRCLEIARRHGLTDLIKYLEHDFSGVERVVDLNRKDTTQ